MMSYFTIDSWLEGLSEGQSEGDREHPPLSASSITAALVSRKRKAEEALERQAAKDLENYLALEPRSLDTFICEHNEDMPGSGMQQSPSESKNRTTRWEWQAMYRVLCNLCLLSTLFPRLMIPSVLAERHRSEIKIYVK